MPEGPEVRKIAESVARRVSGRTLLSIQLLSGRYKDKEPTGIQLFNSSLPMKVVGAGSHGKFMYWILEDELSIWSTLGMTGDWGDTCEKYARVNFILDDGHITFNDQRNFGTLKFVRGKFSLIEKLKSLGPDMLSEDVTDEKFIGCMRKKQTWEITQALMDQSVIAGVGNYIKADSLWLAKISPHRMVCEISDDELSNLNRCIKHIMRENYNAEYDKKFLIYNQKADADGNPVVRELTEDNRTTHWCPSVQF